MSEKKYYVEALDEVIVEYCEHPSPNSLYSVLNGIFEGIEQNYSLPCLAKINDDGDFLIKFVADDRGRESVAALTRLDGEKNSIIADVKMRSLVRIMAENDCEGIVLNPGGEHEFTVPKMLLAFALHAGYQMALDDMSSGD